jgi:hypothetical protein
MLIDNFGGLIWKVMKMEQVTTFQAHFKIILARPPQLACMFCRM